MTAQRPQHLALCLVLFVSTCWIGRAKPQEGAFAVTFVNGTRHTLKYQVEKQLQHTAPGALGVTPGPDAQCCRQLQGDVSYYDSFKFSLYSTPNCQAASRVCDIPGKVQAVWVCGCPGGDCSGAHTILAQTPVLSSTAAEAAEEQLAPFSTEQLYVQQGLPTRITISTQPAAGSTGQPPEQGSTSDSSACKVQGFKVEYVQSSSAVGNTTSAKVVLGTGLKKDPVVEVVFQQYGRCVMFFRMRTRSGRTATVGSMQPNLQLHTATAPDGAEGLAGLEGALQPSSTTPAEAKKARSQGSLASFHLLWGVSHCSAHAGSMRHAAAVAAAALAAGPTGMAGPVAFNTNTARSTSDMRLASPMTAAAGGLQPAASADGAEGRSTPRWRAAAAAAAQAVAGRFSWMKSALNLASLQLSNETQVSTAAIPAGGAATGVGGLAPKWIPALASLARPVGFTAGPAAAALSPHQAGHDPRVMAKTGAATELPRPAGFQPAMIHAGGAAVHLTGPVAVPAEPEATASTREQPDMNGTAAGANSTAGLNATAVGNPTAEARNATTEPDMYDPIAAENAPEEAEESKDDEEEEEQAEDQAEGEEEKEEVEYEEAAASDASEEEASATSDAADLKDGEDAADAAAEEQDEEATVYIEEYVTEDDFIEAPSAVAETATSTTQKQSSATQAAMTAISTANVINPSSSRRAASSGDARQDSKSDRAGNPGSTAARQGPRPATAHNEETSDDDIAQFSKSNSRSKSNARTAALLTKEHTKVAADDDVQSGDKLAATDSHDMHTDTHSAADNTVPRSRSRSNTDQANDGNVADSSSTHAKPKVRRIGLHRRAASDRHDGGTQDASGRRSEGGTAASGSSAPAASRMRLAAGPKLSACRLTDPFCFKDDECYCQLANGTFGAACPMYGSCLGACCSTTGTCPDRMGHQDPKTGAQAVLLPKTCADWGLDEEGPLPTPAEAAKGWVSMFQCTLPKGRDCVPGKGTKACMGYTACKEAGCSSAAADYSRILGGMCVYAHGSSNRFDVCSCRPVY